MENDKKKKQKKKAIIFGAIFLVLIVGSLLFINSSGINILNLDKNSKEGIVSGAGEEIVSWKPNDYYFVSENISVINFWINKYNDYSYGQTVSRVSMRLNNSDEYLANRFVNITIAYPSDQEFLGLNIVGSNPVKEEKLRKEIENIMDDEKLSNEEKVEQSIKLEEEYSSFSKEINFIERKYDKTSKNSDISNKLDSLSISSNNKEKLTINSSEDYELKTFEVEFSSDEEYFIQAFVSSEYGLNEKLYMYVEGSFAGGTGTSGDPYQITNWTNLNELRDNMTASYILINNLSQSTQGYGELASPTANSNQGWDPIGASNDEFLGTFDGQNYTISDLYLNRSGSFGYHGVFSAIDNAYLLNVKTENFTFDGVGLYSGSFIGRSQYSTLYNIRVEEGYFFSDSDQRGGIFGRSEDSFVFNCSSAIFMNTSNSSGFYTGGLGGYVDNTTILNSYATGNVIGYLYNGGLTGYNVIGTVINNSYATGNVTSYGSGCGGLAGYFNTGTITYSYSTGLTNGTGAYEHGLLGRITSETYIDNYYDSQTSGDSDTAFGGTPKTTVQMMSIETFDDNWSIVSVEQKADGYANHDYIWNIVNGSTYPFLSWEYLEPNIWNCSSTQRFDNSSCWSLGSVPVAGDRVLFNSTGTGNCNITNNTMPQNLNYFEVDSSYTGTIYFMPMFAEGDYGGNDVGTQMWNVTNNINISGGTMKIYGDYLLNAVGSYNLSSEGHGQEWRSVNGNITVGSNGIIDGVGLGFLRQTGPGYDGVGTSAGTHGGKGEPQARNPYGNASAPVTLGSGGGDSGLGTAGGSAIKLHAVDLIEVYGSVNMSGLDGAGFTRGGAGGSIWLIADNLTGTGDLVSSGGSSVSYRGGGGGRMRLEYGTSMSLSGMISVSGGSGATADGISGTLTFTDNTWKGDWDLTDNIGLLGGDYGDGNATNILGNFDTNGYNVTIYGDCFYNISSPFLCYNTTSEGQGVWINASGNITISSSSILDGNRLGFPAGAGLGAGGANTAGSHGGVGGGSTSAYLYGNVSAPTSIGSGGQGAFSREGGSAIKLESPDRVIVNGKITMNNPFVEAFTRGGSGGSIWLKANNISGSGSLNTTGEYSTSYRGGGGGRIALTSSDTIEFLGNIYNLGGTGGDTSGGGGTVYINASTSVISSMNITTTGLDGGNISMYDTLFTLNGYYNATGTNADAVILINYTDCSSDFSGATFDPSATYETGCGAGDTCTCPDVGSNWEISLSDYCIISSSCDIGNGNITFIDTGNITFNADITVCLIGDLPASQKGYVGSNVNVSVGGCL